MGSRGKHVAAALLVSLALAACADGEADLIVRNQTTGTWSSLFVRAHTDSAWGPDQLRGITLEPGLAYEIRDVPDRTLVDVRAVDDEGFEYEVHNVHIGFDDETVRIDDSALVQGDAEVVVENQTGVAWAHLYFRPRSDDLWGFDQLFGTPLQHGAATTFTIEVGQTYAVRAETSDGAVYEDDRVHVDDKTTVFGLGPDALVMTGTLVVDNAIDFGNGGDNTIIAVFIRRSEDEGWGSDLLTDSLAPGDALGFDVTPGSYRVRAIDVAGQSYEQHERPVRAGWDTAVVFTVADLQ